MTLSRRATLGAMAGCGLAGAARAQEILHGPIRITAPWTRAAAAGGQGVGYMTLNNLGAAADRLITARSPVARTVELHTHIRDGDVMRMRPVPAIDLPSLGEVRLQPGGLHIMLIGLTAPLRQGETVPLTLVFERAGEVELGLAVQAAGARSPTGTHRH